MAAATFTRPGRPMPVKSRAPVRCRASYQRVGGGGGGGGGVCAGSGNGDAAGAAPFGGFGFFGFGGLIIFRAGFGGGPAGCNSATTGFGSNVVVAGVVKSPGRRMTCTGTVAGWNLGSV